MAPLASLAAQGGFRRHSARRRIRFVSCRSGRPAGKARAERRGRFASLLAAQPSNSGKLRCYPGLAADSACGCAIADLATMSFDVKKAFGVVNGPQGTAGPTYT